MAAKIEHSGHRHAKVVNTGSKRKRISAKKVGRLLGAEALPVRISTSMPAVSLYALRQFIVSQLRSTGGRPGLAEAGTGRNKVPMLQGDWDKLKNLADYYSRQEGVRVSPAQAAASVLHLALADLDVPPAKSGEGNEVGRAGE